jgi:2-polyprenyl-3-methyl-5-hydroxy-6-metoxy-1,4-benzoquinol methylase
MQHELTERAYTNSGNAAVVALVDPAAVSVLDVGCGSGDTARLLRARDPHKRVFGITASSAEAEVARHELEDCWIADLEGELPADVTQRQFDVLILAHVLEHLREPQRVLQRLSRCLKPGGTCVIAVPNVMVWRQRWLFLRGRFEYQRDGVMDETHLRFFSYETAFARLCSEAPELRLVQTRVVGSVPLWVLRRHVLSQPMAARLDAWGCAAWPNLFGSEILLQLRNEPGSAQ